MTGSRQKEELDLLAELMGVARRLAQPFELREVLQQIVDAGREILRVGRASVLLLDREHNELYTEATSSRDELRFPADSGIAGESIAGRRLIRIDDCYGDPRFNREVDRQTGYRTNCLISVPLVGLDDDVVGVMQLLNAEKGRFDADDERLAEMFAVFAALAIQRAQAFEDRLRKVQLERDLDLAREIQTYLLPREVPLRCGYEVAVFSRPAEETGGDIYDLIPLGEGDAEPLMILLADATGHGIGAAVSVTQVRAMLRIAARLGTGLDELGLHLNNQLVDDLSSGRFVTAFVGILDPSRHAIEYHSLGQAPLLHFHAADGRCETLAASSPPLGLTARRSLPRPSPIRLEPGDVFALLSDGFYEYEDRSREVLGKERVAAVIGSHRVRAASDILAELCADLDRFAAGAPQRDDLTAIILKRAA